MNSVRLSAFAFRHPMTFLTSRLYCSVTPFLDKKQRAVQANLRKKVSHLPAHSAGGPLRPAAHSISDIMGTSIGRGHWSFGMRYVSNWLLEVRQITTIVTLFCSKSFSVDPSFTLRRIPRDPKI